MRTHLKRYAAGGPGAEGAVQACAQGLGPVRTFPAGYGITIAGATLSQLENNGVFAQVDCDSRGRVSIEGLGKL